MKILHVIFSFSTGGAETMLVDIINEQSITQKVDLLVVNNVVNEALLRTINKEVTIHYLNRKPGNRNPIPILQFNYKVFKINPTVIHFHNHNAINLLKYKTKAATCLTIHDVNIPEINFYKYKKLFSISNAVLDDVLKRSGINSILVYNGINFEQISANVNFLELDKFKIIQISRLDHQKKGQHVLIKAISILVNHNGLNNLQLNLIGEGSSKEYLKQLAKELNIEKHVNFLGNKTRKFIYENLKNYQMLVQPSIFEGFGLTVVEGMAAKIPVLVSDIDGPMEIIDNGQYGFHFKNGDVEDCAKKIELLLNEYKSEEFKNKINDAFSHANENFNIIKTAQNYLDNYFT
jgi:glycosyltransferase involved in cell wall biosynthesis